MSETTGPDPRSAQRIPPGSDDKEWLGAQQAAGMADECAARDHPDVGDGVCSCGMYVYGPAARFRVPAATERGGE